MHSLVIVDDEPAIRMGLVRHIDWESMGFSVVESFEDGEDALAWLDHHHADVVLTDIRMSVVSGLSLARAIRERGMPTEVVLLSGYRDFDYARAAMQFGVRHYLLKPSRQEEIRDVFAEVCTRLTTGARPGTAAGVRRLLAENRRHLLLRIVDGLFENADDLLAAWRQALLPPITESARASYALLRLGCGEHVCDRARSWPLVFERNLHRLCVDETDRKTVALVEPPDLLHFLLVAGASGEAAAGQEAAAACRTIVRSHIEGGCAALGPVVEHRVITDFDALLQLSARRSEAGVLLPATRIGELVDELFEAAPVEIEQVVQRAGSELIAGRRGLRAVRHAAIDLVSGLLATCRRRAPDRASAGIDYEVLFRCTTESEIASWFGRTIRRLLERPIDAPSGHRRRIVGRARACVHRNLGGQISLDSIAAELYLSPAYFSRLFREESGQTFLDFVTETRVDHAIALLAGRPDLSVAAVARAVGYGDPRYFARVFESRVGRTPSAYRRALAQL